MPGKLVDLTGKRFGRLMVLSHSKRPNTKHGQHYWDCICKCKTKITTTGEQLYKGLTKSCGCLQKERTAEASRTHGLTGNQSAYYQHRRKDKAFVFRQNVSCMFWKILKGRGGGQSVFKHLPYTVEEFKRHIEKQLEPWMNWNNYGTHWQLDHKTARIFFPCTSYKDPLFIKCWSLSNLRPLKTFLNQSIAPHFPPNKKSTTKILEKLKA